MQYYRHNGVCITCHQGQHPAKEWEKRRELHQKLEQEECKKYQKTLAGIASSQFHVIEMQAVDNFPPPKPEPEVQPCNFVMMGKVKTCSKHGIVCKWIK